MEAMNGYIILAFKKMKYSSFSDKAVILRSHMGISGIKNFCNKLSIIVNSSHMRKLGRNT